MEENGVYTMLVGHKKKIESLDQTNHEKVVFERIKVGHTQNGCTKKNEVLDFKSYVGNGCTNAWVKRFGSATFFLGSNNFKPYINMYIIYYIHLEPK